MTAGFGEALGEKRANTSEAPSEMAGGIGLSRGRCDVEMSVKSRSPKKIGVVEQVVLVLISKDGSDRRRDVFGPG